MQLTGSTSTAGASPAGSRAGQKVSDEVRHQGRTVALLIRRGQREHRERWARDRSVTECPILLVTLHTAGTKGLTKPA